MSSRLERLLHFVTSHSARDVPKVGIGHTAAVPPQLFKLMISSDQIGCDSVLSTAQFRKPICSYKKQSDLNLFLFLRR